MLIWYILLIKSDLKKPLFILQCHRLLVFDVRIRCVILVLVAFCVAMLLFFLILAGIGAFVMGLSQLSSSF